MLQIVEQTKEEKMAMYMKLPKKQIVEMLINCNDIITALTQAKNCVIPAVMGELTCDNCGCHPNVIYTTSKGRFCEQCKPSS
jgi:hypothetical protein